MSLKYLAAKTVLETQFPKDSFEKFIQADKIFNTEKEEDSRLKDAIRIMTDLDLIESIVFNGVSYVTTAKPALQNPHVQIDSLIRKAKLLLNIRSSGEEEKLLNLISKWEAAAKTIVKELYTHQTGLSLKKFVKNLGLDFEQLELSDEDEEEFGSESENEPFNSKENYFNNSNYYNNENTENGFDDNESKRLKYDDY